jgi:small-conductance mechanosensitive channel
MQFLDQTFFGNTLQRWAIGAALGLATVMALRILVRLAASRARTFAASTATRVDDLVAELLSGTKFLFLLFLGVYVGSRVVALSPRWLEIIEGVAVIALIVQGGIWATVAIAFFLEAYRQDKLSEDAAAVTTISALGFMSKLVVWSVVLLLTLDNLGVDITTLVTGLGVGGIAVALAVQNILGDLFASLSIVLDKPFVIGDFLIVGDFLGRVERIGLKTTRLRSLSGEEVIFSNTDLLNSRIRNYGRMFERRILFGVGVTYQTPRDKLERIPEILKAAVTAQEQVRLDRAHFKGYGDFSINFEVVYYVLVPDYNVYMDIQQSINLSIHERFEEEGIEFAYPTQTLFLVKENGQSG